MKRLNYKMVIIYILKTLQPLQSAMQGSCGRWRIVKVSVGQFSVTLLPGLSVLREKVNREDWVTQLSSKLSKTLYCKRKKSTCFISLFFHLYLVLTNCDSNNANVFKYKNNGYEKRSTLVARLSSQYGIISIMQHTQQGADQCELICNFIKIKTQKDSRKRLSFKKSTVSVVCQRTL